MSNESKAIGLHQEKINENTSLPQDTAKKSNKKSSAFIIFIFLCLVGGFLYWRFVLDHSAALGSSSAKSKKPQNTTVMVVAAVAQKGDVKVYIDALGSITPLATVDVKSRIDGQLMKVLYKEGQVVQKGDPLVELDERAYKILLNQAEGQLIKDRALLENAKNDLQRYSELYKEESISKQVFDTQKALVHQYEGTIKTDEATVANGMLQISYCKITAPISGTLGLRLVDTGNMVHASDATPIAVITQLSPISVLFSITEDNVPQVMKEFKSKKDVVVDIYDRSDTIKLGSGVLTSMDNQIDATTGTLKLRAVLENKKQQLIPNQFVNVHLLSSVKHDAVLIPTAAVQQGISGSFVYFVKPNLTVTARKIKTGAIQGDNILVSSGLTFGDKVVIDGVDRLKEGTKVQLVNRDSPSDNKKNPSKNPSRKVS